VSLLQTTARWTSGLLGRESGPIRRLRPFYESMLEWSAFGKGIPWPINGVTYRIDPHQRHRLGQNYDAPVAAYLRERVKPGAVCLDVGANVGVYVLQFAHWSGEHGRVIAFEPNPGALTLLKRHVRMNGIESRVEIIPFAVGASEGEATLYALGAEGMSRLGAPNHALAGRTRELTVSVVTLDRFCEMKNLEPDWLFIDIEGFEIAALLGARELIARRRGELNIIVEMHPNVWDSANTSRKETEELLAELGLSVIGLTGQKDPLAEHGIVRLDLECAYLPAL
jgi:FkbM family methyltransferase